MCQLFVWVVLVVVLVGECHDLMKDKIYKN